MDKYTYLANRKNWPKLGDDVLRNLSNSFDDNQLFLEFIELSERLGMLEHNYLELAKDIKEANHLLWLISFTLERSGAKLVEGWNTSNDIKYLNGAVSLFKSSCMISKDFFSSYFQTSFALAMKGETQASRDYFEIGKSIYLRLRDTATNLDNYRHAMVQEFSNEHLQQFENYLAILLNSSDREGNIY